MFVYLKEPMGYRTIGGKRVCGRNYAYGTYGPTNISIEEYKAHKDIIIDADYPTVWLRDKFKRDVPPFNFGTLRAMSLDDLAKFAKNVLGLKYYFKSEQTSDVKAKNALLRSLMLQLT